MMIRIGSDMDLKSTIKQMRRHYEGLLRNTQNISMRDIIEKIIEDLDVLLGICIQKENKK